MTTFDITVVTEALGYAAVLFTIGTYSMKTMIPLRVCGITANCLFIGFSILAKIYPTLLLHSILLPINILRLHQMVRLTKRVNEAQTAELTIKSLIPYLKRRKCKAGEILICHDESADRLFYLLNGEVQIEMNELKKTIGPGNLLGEIGVFAQDGRRMATVRCLTDCEVYELTEAKAKEIYYQNPAFGYAVLRIIITRLLEDLRLSQQHNIIRTQLT